MLMFDIVRTVGKAWKQVKTKLHEEASAHKAFSVKV